MALAKKIWKISKFDKGVGNYNTDGMFWWAQGLEMDFNPPYMRLAMRLFKEVDSGTLATLADVMWSVLFDNTNWMINRLDGKIFKYSYPSWSEVHDNAYAWGGLGLYGDSQLDSYTEVGYLYYASNSYAGRYSKQTDIWTDSWQSFAVSNYSDLCPIQKFLKFICFGNQRYLATWDTGASSWNATRITLPLGYKIKWLRPLTDYLVISAHHSAFGSALFFWDGISQTYNRAIQLPNVASVAGVVDKNALYIITDDGWISIFNGTGLTKLNRFPDIELGGVSFSVSPDAVKVFQGLIYIGKAAHGYNMEKRYYPGGIWVFNPATRALYFKHLMSHGGIGNASGYGVITIGSIFLNSNATAFHVAWYNGSQYVVDASYDNNGSMRPYPYGAIWVSSLLDDEPYRRKRFIQSIINFMRPLPNSSAARAILKCNITERYSKKTAYIARGGYNYFELDYGWADIEVGDEVTVLMGSGASQIRHITAITDVGGGTKRFTVDEWLADSATYNNTSYIMISAFKKIGEIKGSDNPNAVNKLMRFNARSKKAQIKIELRAPAGYTGEWDMGIADVSTIYVPDRIIK